LSEVLQTRVRTAAQLLICKGCCCGRPDRGFPAVPVDRIKAIWKAEKLNRTVQLTISGCLGPCDLPNVVVLVTASGTEWFGRIESDEIYDALIDWARVCHGTGRIVALPEVMQDLRFERFPAQAECVYRTRDATSSG
jgi:cobaltochelatase CobN